MRLTGRPSRPKGAPAGRILSRGVTLFVHSYAPLRSLNPITLPPPRLSDFVRGGPVPPPLYSCMALSPAADWTCCLCAWYCPPQLTGSACAPPVLLHGTLPRCRPNLPVPPCTPEVRMDLLSVLDTSTLDSTLQGEFRR